MDYATAAVDLGLGLHEMISQNSKNRKSHIEISLRLVDKLQALEEMRKKCSADTLPELDERIAGLQSELGELTFVCEKLYKRQPGFRGTIKHIKHSTIDVWDLEERFLEVEKKAKEAQEHFMFMSNIRNEYNISNLRQEFADYKNMWLEVNEAHDTAKQMEAQQVFEELEEETRHREEKWKVRDAKTVEDVSWDTEQDYSDYSNEGDSEGSDDDGREEAEEAAPSESASLEVNQGGPKSSLTNLPLSLESDETDPKRIRLEYEQRERLKLTKSEAMQETISLLSELHNPNSKVPVSRWIFRATTLSEYLYQALGLNKEAIRLFEICLTILRPLADKRPLAFRSLFAKNLANYGRALSKDERHQEALERTQEGLDIYRLLEEEDPGTYRKDVAWTADLVAARLSKVDRNQEVFDFAKEAVEIMKEICLLRPGSDNLTQLARMLGNQAYWFVKAGMDEELEKVRGDLVKARERLAENDMKQHGRFLLGALRELYAVRMRLRKFPQALEVLRRYVEVRKEASENLPAPFVQSLHTLAIKFMDKSEDDMADEVCINAARLKIMKDGQGEQNPDASGWSAAAAMYDELSDRLFNERSDRLAIKASQKSVEIRQKLADEDPETRMPGLATSMSKLANRLAAERRYDDALETAEEAVDIAEELVEDDDAQAAVLAGCLAAKSDRLSDVGLHDDALNVAQKERQILMNLHEKDPEKHDLAFVRSQARLFSKFLAIGDAGQALDYAERAVEGWERLAGGNPKYRFDLGKAYEVLALRYAKIGQNEQAVEVAEKSVTVFQQFVEDKRQGYRTHLAKSLATLSWINAKLGRHAEGRDTIQQTVEIYRKLTEENPKANRSDLASSLYTLCERLTRTSQKKSALKAIQEAIDIYKELEKESPERYSARLADARRLRSRVTRGSSIAKNSNTRKAPADS